MILFIIPYEFLGGQIFNRASRGMILGTVPFYWNTKQIHEFERKSNWKKKDASCLEKDFVLKLRFSFILVSSP